MVRGTRPLVGVQPETSVSSTSRCFGEEEEEENVVYAFFLSKMNPLTNVKNITKLNETELATGSIHKKSWHDMYKESAWIFIGGLEYGLTEGDVLAVFSQYGEIVNINLVRDKKTGKSKGYCFLCYANQKSTVLAVDNFNGIKLCNRTIRVDHVANYKPPKENDKDDEITKMLKFEGCAPQVVQQSDRNEVPDVKIKKKKTKKEKKEKKKKKKNKNKSDSSDSEKEDSTVKVEVKEERHDPGYDKYDIPPNLTHDTVKERHHKRNLVNSRGESSYSYDNYKSKMDKHLPKAEKDNFRDRDKLKIKIKSESESDKDNYIRASSSSKHKRQRSASLSDDSNQNRHKDKRCKQAESNRHSNPKRKHRTAKVSSSSSSDDSSSSQSSEEENLKSEKRYSRKEAYKTQNEKRSFQEESRDRNYGRREHSAYVSKKSSHHDKTEKYSQHKSKTNYESHESADAFHKSSDCHRSRHYRK